MRRYGALGVEFTDIIGFESHPITPRQFFSEMPPELVPRFHLYNTGNDAKVGSVFNPWTHVRALAEPGDFVVVKLDIDSPDIENELMAQLLADEQVRVCGGWHGRSCSLSHCRASSALLCEH